MKSRTFWKRGGSRAFSIIVILVGIGIAAVPVRAETSAGPVLGSTSTLDDYVTYALLHSPLLGAYDDLRLAARHGSEHEKAFPDPMFTYGYFAQSIETRVGPMKDVWAVSQRFPFFGKRSLKGEVAARDADIADRSYDGKRLDLVKLVKEAYFDYYRVFHVRKVTEEEKDVLFRMQDIAQVRYANGQVGQQDVLKAQLALSDLDNRLTLLKREGTTAMSRLNELLNRKPLEPIAEPAFDIPGDQAGSVDELTAAAVERRPELQVTDISYEKAEQMKSLAKRHYWPDLTLAFQYTRIDERDVASLTDNGKDGMMVSASLNLPLWVGNRSAAVKEAEARMAFSRHHRASLEASIRSDVQDAWTKVETAKELVASYRDVILPQAEQAFLAAEAGYRAGEVGFIDYLDSERSFLSVRRAYIGVIADLGKQLAYLERAVGGATEEF